MKEGRGAAQTGYPKTCPFSGDRGSKGLIKNGPVVRVTGAQKGHPKTGPRLGLPF